MKMISWFTMAFIALFTTAILLAGPKAEGARGPLMAQVAGPEQSGVPVQVEPGFANGEKGQAASKPITAEVDWVEETMRGGSTAVALIILIIAGITICIERLWNLRRKHIVPEGLADKVLPLWEQGRYHEILADCDKADCALGRMVSYLVHHREANPELLIPGASDIGTRELRVQVQKSFSLAVIAALAPLLGLLGTMIGMIESFKLVEQFGDDGGASMLAGSISKALITTALGLIIAIPALGVYHYLKYRITHLGVLLDEELEMLVNRWLLLGGKPPPAADAVASGEK